VAELGCRNSAKIYKRCSSNEAIPVSKNNSTILRRRFGAAVNAAKCRTTCDPVSLTLYVPVVRRRVAANGWAARCLAMEQEGQPLHVCQHYMFTTKKKLCDL
jgi:hypothetical protein